MRSRHIAMLLLGILVVAVVVLAGCASDGKVHKEVIDGHDCLVRRNRVNGQVIAMSCDWEN